MVLNPDMVHYACIAKGTTVLAEFNSRDAALGAIAVNCLARTPPFHAKFAHTVRSRTYAFLIDGNFVYFAIFDDKLEKPEGFAFLKSVKQAFARVCKGENRLQNSSSHCFQGELNPVFRQLLGPGLDRVEGLGSPTGQRLSRNGDFQSGPGPIRGRPKSGEVKGLKKMKNRLLGWEKEEDGEDMGYGLIMNKNGGFYSTELSRLQKAKRIWKKQLWVILSLDLMICLILFAVWLWVCSGLKCIGS